MFFLKKEINNQPRQIKMACVTNLYDCVGHCYSFQVITDFFFTYTTHLQFSRRDRAILV